MKKYTDIIARYLRDEMNPAEKLDFETQLKGNAELRAEFGLQKQLVAGMKQVQIKSEINKGFKSASFWSKFKWGFGSVLITGSVVALLFGNKILNKSDHLAYDRNESGQELWADADRNLPSQVYQVDNTKDTILETNSGIILSIPARTFLKGNDTVDGDVEIELKEAMTAAEIVKAGLSTTAVNGQQLETGGMFYVNARQGGENLTIASNKGILANIPNLNPEKDMQLYKGVRGHDGEILWDDPKPFVKPLRTLDITKLNFYPPGFLDTLKHAGWDIKNKRLTDSIYFSFDSPCEGSIAVRQIDEAKDSMHFDVSPLLLRKQHGAELFNRNCAVCHSTGSYKLTGPGMAGVLNRVPSTRWLAEFILNSEKMIRAGDPYAVKVYEENGRATMNVFEGQLSEADINDLIYFLSGLMATDTFPAPNFCEIDPSRIRAIWDKKFNKTLLATKEFEERLQAIFRTCNHQILDLYVRNLDKKMYQVDSLASLMNREAEGPERGNPFHQFYLRKDGGVSISQKQAEKLHAYMEQKQKTYQEMAQEAMRKLKAEDQLLVKTYWDQSLEIQAKELKRMSDVIQGEISLNMDDAYRQLGQKKPPVVPVAENYLGTTITNTGWYNVDMYVRQSTVNRTTLDYTDPKTGKKAVIRYKKLNINIDKASDFDKLYAYLLPKELSSFQRVKGEKGAFTENLNELIEYDLMVVGYKGEKQYGESIRNIKPGTRSISLRKMSNAEIERLSSINRQGGKDLVADLAEKFRQEKFEKQQAVIAKREELRARLMPVVFPCYQAPPAQQQPSEAELR